MPAINFPSPANVNDVFFADNGQSYKFDGIKWISATSNGATGLTGATGAQGQMGATGVNSIPQNAQSAAYTLVASDNGKHIAITTGNVTIPASIFSTGNVVTIVNNSVSSQAIIQGSGLTLQWAGQPTSTTGNRTIILYGIATVLFLSPTFAIISGAGLA